MAKPTAHSSGMRGSEKPKVGPVRAVRIDKVENGHKVSVEHEQHSLDAGYTPPKEHVFTSDDSDAMVAHVLKALGIKKEKEVGEGSPAQDNNGDEEKCNGKCPSCCED